MCAQLWVSYISGVEVIILLQSVSKFSNMIYIPISLLCFKSQIVFVRLWILSNMTLKLYSCPNGILNILCFGLYHLLTFLKITDIFLLVLVIVIHVYLNLHFQEYLLACWIVQLLCFENLNLLFLLVIMKFISGKLINPWFLSFDWMGLQ